MNKAYHTKRRHPYLSLTKWNNELAFWRKETPVNSLFRYNVEAYEERLQEWFSRERKLSTIDSKLQ